MFELPWTRMHSLTEALHIETSSAKNYEKTFFPLKNVFFRSLIANLNTIGLSILLGRSYSANARAVEQPTPAAGHK